MGIEEKPDFGNRLKAVEVRTLEEAIGRTVSELMKEPYTCTIEAVSFAIVNRAELQISLNWAPENRLN